MSKEAPVPPKESRESHNDALSSLLMLSQANKSPRNEQQQVRNCFEISYPNYSIILFYYRTSYPPPMVIV